MKKFGFTLAEVLITLGIIGIVAAITIPVLMQNIQDYQFKQAWKKAYSDVSNATNLLIQENGGDLISILDFDTNTIPQYSKYLRFIKTGTYSTTQETCWSKTMYNPDGSVMLSDTSHEWMKCAELSNGTLLLLYSFSANCDANTWAHPAGVCQEIIVDVNGVKQPNIIGKDIFGIWIERKRAVPTGTAGDLNVYSQCNDASGWACSAKYLYQ